MDFYNDIVKYARIARKNNDSVFVYYDKTKKAFYRKSWGGLVYNDMVLYPSWNTHEAEQKLINYILKYNNNGIKLVLEEGVI